MYQSFDIISQGTIVKNWKDPNECVRILTDFIKNETVLNLIVTETWINVDVTISSFQPKPVGAYGNIEYAITFVEKKPLQIYTTNELNIAQFVKKTRPRNDQGGAVGGGGLYTVVGGDTLSGIAAKKLKSVSKWTSIYDANADTIEAEEKKHGKASSDHGHWIWPGEVLILPG